MKHNLPNKTLHQGAEWVGWGWLSVALLLVLGLVLITPASAAVVNIKLNPALVLGGNVSGYFQISADSSRVVYLADQETAGVDELYASGVAINTYLPLILKNV